jgi:hypothetical protein
MTRLDGPIPDPRAEVARLRELLLDAFFQLAAEVRDGSMAGWWDSLALSTVRDVGDELVAAGLLERHPDGAGRRWFYRPGTGPLAEKPNGPGTGPDFGRADFGPTPRPKCPHCDGCGQVADRDGAPWNLWQDLPAGSDLAVRMGLVKPVPCSECGGSGRSGVPR